MIKALQQIVAVIRQAMDKEQAPPPRKTKRGVVRKQYYVRRGRGRVAVVRGPTDTTKFDA